VSSSSSSSSSSLGGNCELARELSHATISRETKRQAPLILPAHKKPVTCAPSRGKKRPRPKNCPWACNCVPHMRTSTSGNPHHHQDCVKQRWLRAYNAGIELPVPTEGMVIASISKRAQDAVPPMKYIGGSWVVLTAQALRTTATSAGFFSNDNRAAESKTPGAPTSASSFAKYDGTNAL